MKRHLILSTERPNSYTPFMCFSARLLQDLQALSRLLGIPVDTEAFKALFRQRMEGSGAKISRALEANFSDPQDTDAREIKSYIDQYRVAQATAWEQDLFKQKKRLADAQRSLKGKETKRAREDERIATNKIENFIDRLADLRRRDVLPKDDRIFPMTYAPIAVNDNGELWIRPMRYGCRLQGKPANYDHRFPGTYNARRDNLNGFWSQVYGSRHAVMVVQSFYENVPTHLYEGRELGPDEVEQNTVLYFQPQPAQPMIVACVWSPWSGKGEADLNSFAAVTDEPPPEIAATGHQRCIIALNENNVREWLSSTKVSKQRLDEILSEPAQRYYEHQIAA